MKWFLDFTTRAKLFSGFGLMILFLAIVAAIAYRGTTSTQQSQKTLYEQEFANATNLLGVGATVSCVAERRRYVL